MTSRLRRVLQITGRVLLLCSVLLNVALLREFKPLLPYYQSYWHLRVWASINILGRYRPDRTIIYQQPDFTLQPSPRPTPTYRLDDVLEAKDPVALADQLRTDVREAFALDRIPRGALEFQNHSSNML